MAAAAAPAAAAAAALRCADIIIDDDNDDAEVVVPPRKTDSVTKIIASHYQKVWGVLEVRDMLKGQDMHGDEDEE